MSKFTDVNRKHYRFPAYKDDEGVKLHNEKRNLFAKDRSWLLTDEGRGQRNSFGQTPATPPAKLFNESALNTSSGGRNSRRIVPSAFL